MTDEVKSNLSEIIPEYGDNQNRQPEVESELSKILPESFNEKGEYVLPSTPAGSGASVTVSAAPANFDYLNALGATAAGAGAGQVASKLFPMQPFNDKEIKKAADKLEIESRAAGREIGNFQDQLDVLHNAHQNAQAELEDASQALKEAQSAAEKHGVFTPSTQKNEFGRLIVDESELPKALGKSVVEPLGGQGTLHYGEAFGMTPYDAAKAIDMTKGQHGKGAWDIAEQARAAESKIGPGYAMVPERSNLMLPTELPKVRGSNVDLKAAESARRALLDATLAHKEAQRGVAQARLDIEKHMENPPSSLTRQNEKVARAADTLELLGKAEGPVSKVARATVARLPGALMGAGVGYDLYQLKHDVESGNVTPAMLHGLSAAGGALSMVPTPITKGVGAAMMTPALGYDVYQALKK